MASQGERIDTKQFMEVREWLLEAFTSVGLEVPEYEITSLNVAGLHRLAVLSQRATFQEQVLTEDMEEKAAEYVSEASRLRELASFAGLDERHMSHRGRGDVADLAAIADLANVDSPSPNFIMLGLTELSLQTGQVAERRQRVRQEMAQLKVAHNRALELMAQLNRAVDGAESELVAQQEKMVAWERNAELLRPKVEQYSQQLVNSKVKLEKSGYHADISHGALVKLAKELKDLKMKLQPLAAAVDTYCDLPPDKLAAEIEVEKLRQEIDSAKVLLEGKLAQSSMGPS